MIKQLELLSLPLLHPSHDFLVYASFIKKKFLFQTVFRFEFFAMKVDFSKAHVHWRLLQAISITDSFESSLGNSIDSMRCRINSKRVYFGFQRREVAGNILGFLREYVFAIQTTT